MNLPDEFFEKSIPFFEPIERFLKKGSNMEEFEYWIRSAFESVHSFLNVLIDASALINQNQLTQARLALKNRHQLNLLIRVPYSEIKSLLTGLLITSSIYNADKLVELRKSWTRYDSETEDDVKLTHHQKMYREFKKIETIEELVNFNQYFKAYFQRLIIETVDDQICRADYTIEHIKDFDFFKKDYKSERQKLDKLISKTNRLKKQLKPAL